MGKGKCIYFSDEILEIIKEKVPAGELSSICSQAILEYSGKPTKDIDILERRVEEKKLMKEKTDKEFKALTKQYEEVRNNLKIEEFEEMEKFKEVCINKFKNIIKVSQIERLYKDYKIETKEKYMWPFEWLTKKFDGVLYIK